MRLHGIWKSLAVDGVGMIQGNDSHPVSPPLFPFSLNGPLIIQFSRFDVGVWVERFALSLSPHIYMLHTYYKTVKGFWKIF
jgi:hypothetical protein